jgi:hypothetical protein
MARSVAVTGEELHHIADPAIELILRKNHDYGNSWAKQGLAGVLVRLADKFFRFENLAGGAEALIVDEKIEDTLQDALAYSLLGLLYLRAGREHQPENEDERQRAALTALLGEPDEDELTRFRFGERANTGRVASVSDNGGPVLQGYGFPFSDGGAPDD